MSADPNSYKVVNGDDPAEAFDAATVIVASGMDKWTRLWTATAIPDEKGTILGCYVDRDGAVIWEGDSVAKAQAIVAAHCG